MSEVIASDVGKNIMKMWLAWKRWRSAGEISCLRGG
jgi:hypothetical protein